MVRSAIAPSADAQKSCILWLEQYFEKYGDHKPNADQINLQILTKKEVYEKYTFDFKSKYNENIVPIKKFYELWSVLFPKSRIKPWCDIPGKCDICAAIDKGRRINHSDPVVLEKFKEAHLLHRGGTV